MKLCVFLLVFSLCLTAFAACSKSEEDGNASALPNANTNNSADSSADSSASSTAESSEGSTDESSESSVPKGEVFDVGQFSVFVPNGWKAFHNTDIHADDPTTKSDHSVYVTKGATNEMQIFTNPYVKLDYGDEDLYLMAPPKDFYDNVVELEPITLGGLTWEGFTGESIGYYYTFLYIDQGDDQYMVTIQMGDGDNAISIEDEAVKAIIDSIKLTGVTNESTEENVAE